MKENVKFDEWKKLDLRVGTIKEVKPHPKADKLYLLKVDIGEEIQLVAGIKENYKPEELTGKQIIVIKNLEPVKIRGEESNGMLLAAVKDKEVALVTVDKKIENNAKVE